MSALEREPFANPFEPFATPEAEVTGSEVYGNVPEVMATDAEHSHSINDNGRSKLRQLTVYMPPALNERVRKQVESERRLMRVVMDRVVEEFLDNCPNEPRPYIPERFTVNHEAYQFRISPEYKDRLYVRAKAEGRPVSVLFLRAILDYLDKYDNKEVVE